MTVAGPTFDTVQIGDMLPEFVRSVSQDDILRMAVASLDYNPVHINPEWAKRAQVFGVPSTVAHGMMTMSFQVSTITNWISSVGGRLRSLDSKFTKPVFPGDTITCRGQVIEIHHMGKLENFIVVNVTTVNQHGETVAAGKADVAIA